jgi:hypothetical protein
MPHEPSPATRLAERREPKVIPEQTFDICRRGISPQPSEQICAVYPKYRELWLSSNGAAAPDWPTLCSGERLGPTHHR